MMGSVPTLGLGRTCLPSGALAWAQLSSYLASSQVHRQQAGPGIGGCSLRVTHVALGGRVWALVKNMDVALT